MLLPIRQQVYGQTHNLPRPIGSPAAVGNKPPAAVPGPAGPMNYVRTFTPRVAITSEEQVLKGSVDSVQVSTTYFDGLGRPVQMVTRQESPLRRDVVQPITYDAFGRQAKDYLPYTAEPTKAGDYRPVALVEQYRFYTQPTSFNTSIPKTDYPFSEKLDQQEINCESPSRGNTPHYYSNQTFPVLDAFNSQVLTVSYYDGY